MKQFDDLVNYIMSIPQNNQLRKDLIVNKIREKERECINATGMEGKTIKFIDKDNLEPAIGDVVKFHIVNMEHPALIIDIKDDVCMAVILSTKERVHNVTRIIGSRLFAGSFVTSTIVCLEKSMVKRDWVGIFDVPLDIDRIKRELKNYYSKLFKNAKDKTKEVEKAQSVDTQGYTEETNGLLQENAGI